MKIEIGKTYKYWNDYKVRIDKKNKDGSWSAIPIKPNGKDGGRFKIMKIDEYKIQELKD